METLKIIAFILLFILAFVWGLLGAANEFADNKMKSRMTYTGGSLISAAITIILMAFYLKLF